MNLVEIRLVEAISQARVQARPPVVAAHAQLVAEQLEAHRNVDIDQIMEGSGSNLVVLLPRGLTAIPLAKSRRARTLC